MANTILSKEQVGARVAETSSITGGDLKGIDLSG